MRTTRSTLLGVIAVALFGATTASTAAATAADTTPVDQPWIAYQTGYDKTTGWGPEGIWLVHPDGTGVHQVGAGANEAQELPDWSPDGSRLAFTTRGGEHEPLVEYDLATDTYHQLFACDGDCLGDDEPAYSPDGTKVAFIRAFAPFVPFGQDWAPSDCSIWIGDLSSGAVHRLTNNGSCDRETMPRWSPDGTQLTYYRELLDTQTGDVLATAVFVLDVATAEEQRITPWNRDFGEPDWSPGGDWIVMADHPLHSYNAPAGAYVSNLYRIHPDGSGLEQMTTFKTNQERATQPRYTPDGQQIVFTAVTHNSRELWLLPTSGGKPDRVTNGGIATHGTMQP